MSDNTAPSRVQVGPFSSLITSHVLHLLSINSHHPSRIPPLLPPPVAHNPSTIYHHASNIFITPSTFHSISSSHLQLATLVPPHTVVIDRFQRLQTVPLVVTAAPLARTRRHEAGGRRQRGEEHALGRESVTPRPPRFLVIPFQDDEGGEGRHGWHYVRTGPHAAYTIITQTDSVSHAPHSLISEYTTPPPLSSLFSLPFLPPPPPPCISAPPLSLLCSSDHHGSSTRPRLRYRNSSARTALVTAAIRSGPQAARPPCQYPYQTPRSQIRCPRPRA